MPNGKTPQEILDEFKSFPTRGKPGNKFNTRIIPETWLRSSMLSLLEGVMEKCEAERTRYKTMYVREKAINDCIAVIQSVIDSIKE